MGIRNLDCVVECDECGYEETFILRPVMCGVEYGDLRPKLVKAGWLVEGSETICPRCGDEDE